ncbi:amino acid ABC transporter ATP-binding protein [Marinibacterium profundimaris]|uniref:Peptide ABC transporter ATP-binding protein n=1 Tax=Marinibacterium profundimaris TaxID=1679460 RepID=A0A225NES3_9RHOB|nr:amino acid ABC transporter ATP-binding protein [Marinibacterium profundimaris]OWU71469.1 peptide ABC transporter ATP-binding protein [Marinibacterium profundimaris]
MAHLELDNISAAYGKLRVLDGIDISVGSGETVGLIGPSGSGKSTILRVLTGLLKPEAGQVRVGGEPINFDKPAEIRRLRDRAAIVFQQYNLFQNLTVLENVMIAPTKVRGRKPRDVRPEAEHLLAKVGLADKINSYPDQLSGGQQQRVAIARGLCLKPEILLLDEVTAALDPELVSEVLDTIRGLAEDGMTMLIVSHEMGFIREISARVAFMADGKVVELGSPAQIFDAPEKERTRDFVGKILRH